MQISERLAARALRMGGTVTGEHGVGIGKLDYMGDEHGPAWAVMADSASLYARGVLGSVAAGLSMALPLVRFQAWQWRAGHLGVFTGRGPP